MQLCPSHVSIKHKVLEPQVFRGPYDLEVHWRAPKGREAEMPIVAYSIPKAGAKFGEARLETRQDTDRHGDSAQELGSR